jgi:hypothetical protein
LEKRINKWIHYLNRVELKNLTNTAKLRNTRKDIARMKTVLRERELAAQNNENKNQETK